VSISTYSDLQDAVASELHRDDLTDEIQRSIALAESEMQIDCKLVEFESDATITVTSGSGPLPTGFLGMRSAYWNGDTSKALRYIPPPEFDSLRNVTGGTPAYYTVSGSTLRVNEGGTGSVVGMVNTRFTALSDSNTTNALLTNHPDAYLYGTLKHAAVHTRDTELMQTAGLLFNAAKERIKTNNKDRKYAGPLQVRAR
jgi:hypothetical protein